MKIYHFAVACLLAFVWGVIACSVENQAVLKKQSEDIRTIGEAYLSQGKDTAALREFRKAEAIYADDPFLQFDIGLVYATREKYKIAVGYFKKALELNPSFSPARNNLGAAYLALKDYQAAITTLEEVLEDDLYATPHYPMTLLGQAYFEKEEYARAEDYFRMALKRRPRYIRALNWLGRTLMATDRPKEAVAVFEKSTRIRPTLGETYLDLARAHTLLKNVAQARHAYEKVIELAPPDSEDALTAKKALIRLRGKSQ